MTAALSQSLFPLQLASGPGNEPALLYPNPMVQEDGSSTFGPAKAGAGPGNSNGLTALSQAINTFHERCTRHGPDEASLLSRLRSRALPFLGSPLMDFTDPPMGSALPQDLNWHPWQRACSGRTAAV